MENSTLLKRRRSDFYTSISILILAIAMMLKSFTFPMKESYAGVENVWYVSPALLPLLVSGLMILLSLVLLKKAITDGGMQQAIEDFPALKAAMFSENFLRFIIIILYLSSYVYGLIPNGDFFLASMIFLFAFIVPFYLDSNNLFMTSFWPFALGSLAIGIFGHFNILSTTTIDFIMIGIMVYMIFFCWLNIKANGQQKAKWRISLLTSVITPLVLIPAFKFGLLVPLPTEGIVIKLMETIVH